MLTRLPASAVVLTFLGCLATAHAHSEERTYPTKPIRLVVPFPPGGATDAVARVVSHELSVRLKQPVVVDNRSGAGGNIGAEQVAKSSPNGYTLLVGTISTNAINESLYRGLSFSARADLKPVSFIASFPLVLVTSCPDINSVEDLMRLARQAPNTITYASPGSGTAPHLAAKLFERFSHTTMTHVPYKGSAAALADVMAGRVDVTFDTGAAALPQIKAGRLKGLAVTAPKVAPLLERVPTTGQLGMPVLNISAWNGIFAPKGTPASIIAILDKEIRMLLSDPAVAQRIFSAGGIPMLQNESEFSVFVKSEHEKYRDLIQRSSISLD